MDVGKKTYGHIIGELEDELAVDRTVFHDISCLIQRRGSEDQLDMHVGICQSAGAGAGCRV
jgi:hypothetical protein